MGPGGPGGPRSPGGPWGGTGAVRRGHGGGTAQLRGAPTASGKDLGGGSTGGHPPARLSRRGCPGHRGDRGRPRSPNRGCHPAGSSTASAPGLDVPRRPRHGPAKPRQAPQRDSVPCPQLHASLTRASSALGNWAKHWKKTQSHPGGGRSARRRAPGAQRRTLRVLRTRLSPPLSPWDTPSWMGRRHKRALSVPMACPWCAPSVPSPALACCCAPPLQKPMPSGASLLFAPGDHHFQGAFRCPEAGEYSREHSPRCRGRPACPGPPSPP